MKIFAWLVSSIKLHFIKGSKDKVQIVVCVLYLQDNAAPFFTKAFAVPALRPSPLKGSEGSSIFTITM